METTKLPKPALYMRAARAIAAQRGKMAAPASAQSLAALRQKWGSR